MVTAVVVGSLVMDLAFRIPRAPTVGGQVVASAFAAYRGGKGYNQAVAMSRLGAEVTLLGAVGGDLHGDDLLASLAVERIDARRVVQLRGTPTAVAAPLVLPDGAVSFVHYPGANARLSPAHCVDLPDCDVVLLQGEIPPTTSEYVTRSYRRRGTPVHLNPSPVDNVTPDMLNGADVLTPNAQEAADLSGQPRDADAVTTARALAHPGLRVAINPGSGAGAWAADGDSAAFEVLTGADAHEVVDTTGARDAFVAGLALRLAEGAAFADAVAFAAAAARLAAAVAGAEPSLPTRAAVERLLAG